MKSDKKSSNGKTDYRSADYVRKTDGWKKKKVLVLI